jgi:rhodanese-related sulfurtransferase
MKTVLLFFSVFLFGQLLLAQDNLSPEEFEKNVKSGKYQLLDVRTAKEFGNGHLAKALQADWLNKEQFAERVKYLDKQQPLLVYCASGIRSEQAATWLRSQGFANVQNLKGGTAAWLSGGRGLEGAAKAGTMTIALLKQQISAGTVLVDVGAEWCPPCKTMEPILEQLKKELGTKYTLTKVDGGADTEAMQYLQAAALPTFIVYKNGKEVWRRQGVVSLKELKDALQ